MNWSFWGRLCKFLLNLACSCRLLFCTSCRAVLASWRYFDSRFCYFSSFILDKNICTEAAHAHLFLLVKSIHIGLEYFIAFFASKDKTFRIFGFYFDKTRFWLFFDRWYILMFNACFKGIRLDLRLIWLLCLLRSNSWSIRSHLRRSNSCRSYCWLFHLFLRQLGSFDIWGLPFPVKVTKLLILIKVISRLKGHFAFIALIFIRSWPVKKFTSEKTFDFFNSLFPLHFLSQINLLFNTFLFFFTNGLGLQLSNQIGKLRWRQRWWRFNFGCFVSRLFLMIDIFRKHTSIAYSFITNFFSILFYFALLASVSRNNLSLSFWTSLKLKILKTPLTDLQLLRYSSFIAVTTIAKSWNKLILLKSIQILHTLRNASLTQPIFSVDLTIFLT